MKGRITTTGYRRNSPDVRNDFNIIPSNRISMKGVDFPVLGIDNLGNTQLMHPGGEYEYQGDYVTELPMYGSGGLTQWFAEEWVDIKTGKKCGRSGKDKKGRPYPACRPSKRVNKTTPKTRGEMSAAEKAKFKRKKKSGKRIDYNHKRELGGALDMYQTKGETPLTRKEVFNVPRTMAYEDGKMVVQDKPIWDGFLDETTVTASRLPSPEFNLGPQATISQYTPPSNREYLLNKLENPMTALGYILGGKDMPNKIGRENAFDYAVDVINPLTYVNTLGDIYDSVSEGDIIGAGIDAITLAPIVPTAVKQGKNLFKRSVQVGNKFVTPLSYKRLYQFNPFANQRPPFTTVVRTQMPGQTGKLVMGEYYDDLANQGKKLNWRQNLDRNSSRRFGWGRGFSSYPGDIMNYSNPSFTAWRGYDSNLINPELLIKRLPTSYLDEFKVGNLSPDLRRAYGVGAGKSDVEFILPIDDVLSAERRAFSKEAYDEIRNIRNAELTPHWFKGFQEVKALGGSIPKAQFGGRPGNVFQEVDTYIKPGQRIRPNWTHSPVSVTNYTFGKTLLDDEPRFSLSLQGTDILDEIKYRADAIGSVGIGVGNRKGKSFRPAGENLRAGIRGQASWQGVPGNVIENMFGRNSGLDWRGSFEGEAGLAYANGAVRPYMSVMPQTNIFLNDNLSLGIGMEMRGRYDRNFDEPVYGNTDTGSIAPITQRDAYSGMGRGAARFSLNYDLGNGDFIEGYYAHPDPFYQGSMPGIREMLALESEQPRFGVRLRKSFAKGGSLPTYQDNGEIPLTRDEIFNIPRTVRYENSNMVLQDKPIWDGFLDEVTITPTTASEIAWQENRANQSTGGLEPIYPLFDLMSSGLRAPLTKGAKAVQGALTSEKTLGALTRSPYVPRFTKPGIIKNYRSKFPNADLRGAGTGDYSNLGLNELGLGVDDFVDLTNYERSAISKINQSQPVDPVFNTFVQRYADFNTDDALANQLADFSRRNPRTKFEMNLGRDVTPSKRMQELFDDPELNIHNVFSEESLGPMSVKTKRGWNDNRFNDGSGHDWTGEWDKNLRSYGQQGFYAMNVPTGNPVRQALTHTNDKGELFDYIRERVPVADYMVNQRLMDPDAIRNMSRWRDNTEMGNKHNFLLGYTNRPSVIVSGNRGFAGLKDGNNIRKRIGRVDAPEWGKSVPSYNTKIVPLLKEEFNLSRPFEGTFIKSPSSIATYYNSMGEASRYVNDGPFGPMGKYSHLYYDPFFTTGKSQFAKGGSLPSYQTRGEVDFQSLDPRLQNGYNSTDATYVRQDIIDPYIVNRSETQRLIDESVPQTATTYVPPEPKEWLLNKAANPVATLGYIARGQRIPDRINNDDKDNALDYAFDIINPGAWANYAAESEKDFLRGDVVGGVLNAVGAIPAVPAAAGTATKTTFNLAKGTVKTAAPVSKSASLISGRLPEGVKKWIRGLDQGQVPEYIIGVEKGINDVLGIGVPRRPFFETFPITRSQRLAVEGLQDAAALEAEAFVKAYTHDGAQLQPWVVNKLQDWAPGATWQTNLRNQPHLRNKRVVLTDTRLGRRSSLLTPEEAVGVGQKRIDTRGFANLGEGSNMITYRNQGWYFNRPSDIAEVVTHEGAHGLPQSVLDTRGIPLGTHMSQWNDNLNYFANPAYNPAWAPHVTEAHNVSKKFTPNPFQNPSRAWDAAPIEFDAEKLAARFKLYKDWQSKGANMSPETFLRLESESINPFRLNKIPGMSGPIGFDPEAFQAYYKGQLSRHLINPNMPVREFNTMNKFYRRGGQLPKAQKGNGEKHTVASGETFYGIANKNGIAWEDLVSANPGIDIEKLSVGQIINIPSVSKSGGVKITYSDPELNILQQERELGNIKQPEPEQVEEVKITKQPVETKTTQVYDGPGYFPEALLLKQAYKESTFNPAAQSKIKDPAQGFAQFRPITVRELQRLGFADDTFDPFDYTQSIGAQRDYMNYLYTRPWIDKPNQSEEVRLAKTLAAYNWGPEVFKTFLTDKKAAGVDIYNSLDWVDQLPGETGDYINKILLDSDEQFQSDYQKALKDTANLKYINLYNLKAGGESLPVFDDYDTFDRAWLAARKKLGRSKQFMYGGKVRSTDT